MSVLVRGLPVAALAMVMLSIVVPLAAQVRGINALFVTTTDGAIELIAYAEEAGRGILKLQSGSLEDVPTVREVVSIICNIPTWVPAEVIAASEAIFRDDRAERRSLRMTGRKLNVYAVELRVPELARREVIESLLSDVKASPATPGFAFIVLSSGDYRRYYPVRLTLERPQGR